MKFKISYIVEAKDSLEAVKKFREIDREIINDNVIAERVE